MATYFIFKGIQFTVKVSNRVCPGRLIYRDSNHIGGPWSLVDQSINNKSLDLKFRRSLRLAANGLVMEENEIPELKG